MFSGKLRKQVLPQDKPYTREQSIEEKHRFIAFLKTTAAKNLYEDLGQPFDPDGREVGK